MATVVFEITGGQVIPEISMPSSATILELKEQIAERLDVGVNRQSLWFNNMWLDNHHPIEFYGFQTVAVVELSVSPLPAEQPKFPIVVKSSTAVTNVKVKETYTVGALKSKIQRRWAIPSNLLTLNHLHTEMNRDDLPLSAYYINEGSEVEVIVKLESR